MGVPGHDFLWIGEILTVAAQDFSSLPESRYQSPLPSQSPFYCDSG